MIGNQMQLNDLPVEAITASSDNLKLSSLSK